MSRRAIVCSYGPPRHDRDSGSRRLWHLIGLLRDAGWSVSFLSASRVDDPRYASDLLRSASRCTTAQRHVWTTCSPRATSTWRSARSGRSPSSICPCSAMSRPTTPSSLTRSTPSSSATRAGSSASDPPGGPRLLGGRLRRRDVGELNVYAAADGVLTVSPEEAQLIGAHCSATAQRPWRPRRGGIKRSRVPFESGAACSFVGSFRHPPNADALAYLCHESRALSIPRPRAQHPLFGGRRGLSGATCAPTLGLSTSGWSAGFRLEPYLARALCRRTAPLRRRHEAEDDSGAHGGTPTVARAIGAEGLHLEDGGTSWWPTTPSPSPRRPSASPGRSSVGAALPGAPTHVAEDHSDEAVAERFLPSSKDVLARKPAFLAAALPRRRSTGAPSTSSPSRRCLQIASSPDGVPPAARGARRLGAARELVASTAVQARHSRARETASTRPRTRTELAGDRVGRRAGGLRC